MVVFSTQLLHNFNSVSFANGHDMWHSHFSDSEKAARMCWVLTGAPINQGTITTATVTTIVGALFVILPSMYGAV